MEVLKGKKELIAHGLTFLTVLATSLGFTDFAAPLAKVSAAIAAGDPQVILVAVLGLGFTAASFFRRVALNREGVTK